MSGIGRRTGDNVSFRDATAQSRGLEAIARGFMELGVDDQEQLRLELPVYDALYEWAKLQVAGVA